MIDFYEKRAENVTEFKTVYRDKYKGDDIVRDEKMKFQSNFDEDVLRATSFPRLFKEYLHDKKKLRKSMEEIYAMGEKHGFDKELFTTVLLLCEAYNPKDLRSMFIWIHTLKNQIKEMEVK